MERRWKSAKLMCVSSMLGRAGPGCLRPPACRLPFSRSRLRHADAWRGPARMMRAPPVPAPQPMADYIVIFGAAVRADGSPSYNLFGIKAGKSWNGATAEATTTEYVNGQPQQSVERFRAYGSYEEAFRDYANLLRNNSRFSAVIGSQDGTEFAKRLQQAGYATDPMYADKLSRIINGPALRQALIG
ncbi:MAG: glucosaminidase domain-containing protein [Burkholderiales bacterium]|nr:glucosaminidase domain-containing protein [Burkholderiales bacterium]